tara:strand:- start:70073 stop:70321 length:249 start_codon:yes stop_codon:yes gene_type:complete
VIRRSASLRTANIRTVNIRRINIRTVNIRRINIRMADIRAVNIAMNLISSATSAGRDAAPQCLDTRNAASLLSRGFTAGVHH